MDPVTIGLLINLAIKLLPTIEKIASGQLRQEEVDFNSLLKEDDFLKRAEEIRKQKEEGVI